MPVAIVGPEGYIAKRLRCHLDEVGSDYCLVSTRKRSDGSYMSSAAVGYIDELGQKELEEMKISCAILCVSMNANECEKDPRFAKEVNTLGVVRLVEKMINAGVGRFLYLSTIRVYGEDLVGNIEEGSPVRPITVYAQTHYDTEKALEQLTTQEGVEVCALRLSNVFGAPVDRGSKAWSLVTNNFAKQMAQTGRIHVRSPNVVKNIVPMGRVVDLMSLWISGNVRTSGYRVVNVGGAVNVRMDRLAEVIRGLYNSQNVDNLLGRSEQDFQYSLETVSRLTRVNWSNDRISIMTELIALCQESDKVFAG